MKISELKTFLLFLHFHKVMIAFYLFVYCTFDYIVAVKC